MGDLTWEDQVILKVIYQYQGYPNTDLEILTSRQISARYRVPLSKIEEYERREIQSRDEMAQRFLLEDGIDIDFPISHY